MAKQVIKYKCLKCFKEKAQLNFYANNNPLYSCDKFPICKDCISEHLGTIESDGYRDRTIAILSMMNRPFINMEWTSNSVKMNFGLYLRSISSLQQHNSKGFSDSDFFKQLEMQGLTYEDFEITNEMRMFWRNFSDEEIPILEIKYQDLCYGKETAVQKSIYKSIAINQYLLEETRNPVEIQKLIDTISKLMNDAGIKPTQDTGGGIEDWGQWIKKIEETEPIPEPSEEFKDVDRIGKYFSKWFVGQMKRVFGLSSEAPEPFDDGLDVESVG